MSAGLSTRGVHLIAEYHGCAPDRLNHLENVKRVLRRAAEAAGATVLSVEGHRFEPQGVAAVAMLAESHVSLHTWPERGYAAADFYTCGGGSPRLAHAILREELQSHRAEILELSRGALDSASSLSITSQERATYDDVARGAPDGAQPRSPSSDGQLRKATLFETAIHDLKNPIAIARMNLDWVRPQLGDALAADVGDALDEAHAATHTMQRLVEAMLLASRIETKRVTLRAEPVDLGAVASAARAALRLEIEERGVEVVKLGEAPAITGDPAMLTQAMTAMLRLLIRRSPQGGAIQVELGGEGGASLRASSSAEPFAAHESDFELHVCKLVVGAHGGSVEVVSKAGAGLGLALRFPLPAE